VRRISKALLPTLALSSLISVVAACSDDAPAEKAEGNKDDKSGASNMAVLADNAHGVGGEPIAMDDTTITFNDNAESATFKVNDILAPKERIKKPYLRKITGIEKKPGGQVVFKTVNASMTELFKVAHIHQKINFEDTRNAAPNSEFIQTQSINDSFIRPLSPTIEPLPASATFTFGGKKIEFGGNGYFDSSMTYLRLAGGVEFDYDYEAWYDWTPTLVRLVASGSFDMRLAARAGAAGSVTTDLVAEEWPIKPHLVTLYFQAGPVPIFIDVNLAFESKIDVQFTGAVEMQSSTTTRFGLKAGAEYRNGNWSSINEMTSGYQDEFSMTGEASATIGFHPIDTKLQFQFYGLIGPFLELDPYGTIEGTLVEGTLQRTLGLKGSVGGNVEVLGYKLAEVKLDLFDWKTELDTMQACMSAASTRDGGAAGVDRCKLDTLRNCIQNGGGAGCVSLPQPGGGGNACGSPQNYDAICDVGKLLQCRCEKLYAGRSDAGVTAPPGDGGDCYAKYCQPCTKDQAVCPTTF